MILLCSSYSRRLSAVFLLVFMLMGCEESESKEASETKSTPSANNMSEHSAAPPVEPRDNIARLQQKLCADAPWPNSLDSSLTETPVYQKFNKACQSLHMLEGVAFEGYDRAYLCRTFLTVPSMSADMTDGLPPREEVEAAFADHTSENNLMQRYRFNGTGFSILILTDASHQPRWFISNIAALSEKPVTLRSADAAAAWAYLYGALGEGYSPKALCKADISETSSGWAFKNTDIWYNCEARKWRDLTVSKTGKLNVQRTEIQLDENGLASALCID